MRGHRERLCAVAEKHGLRPLIGEFSVGDYWNYAADLAMLELGLLAPDEIEQPSTWEERQAAKTAPSVDWIGRIREQAARMMPGRLRDNAKD